MGSLGDLRNLSPSFT